jgi:hypothetical protein
VDPGEGFIRLAELLPGVQDAIRSLEPGHVSAIYRIGDQFAVSRLIERRQAPTPDARAKAEAELLSRLQTEAIAKYLEELKRKHTRVDEAVYKGLDFDAAKPGFDTYLKDNRVLVSITGAEPIRVHDLADAVRKRLFHGPQRAAEKDRLNRKKAEVLEDLIAKRVVVLEARAKGLDRKPEYISRREEAERELVFGAFVSKVIEPEVKVTDAEVRQYYEAHRKELTAPDMVRVESIAFGSRKDAEAALAKLRAGADPAWMRSNAPGRLDPKTHQDLLDFPAAPLLLGDLPADLRQSLSNARSGEYRLHGTAGGTTYVILLKELLPGRTLPLEDASGRIRAILMGQTRQKLFDGYIAKLRQASQVRILVTPAELEKLAATPPGK